MKTHDLSDFNLSVTLSAVGYRIDSLDFTNPKRVNFCFIPDEGFLNSVEAYWKGELSVEPKKLFAHQKDLKDRLYASQRNTHRLSL